MPPSPAEAAADLFAERIDDLAAETRRRLLAIWDSLAPWDDAALDEFHRIARPLVQASAQVAVELAGTYSAAVFGEASPASPLIAQDAAARLFDPLDRITRLLGSGATTEEATAAARSVVDDLGHDTAYRSARQAIAETSPPGKRWQRRVTGKSCKWCLSLASAVFNTAESATFGHTRCDCIPFPVDAVAAHNKSIIDAAGGVVEVRKYRQLGKLRQSERTARRRQEQARRELLTETDPARRDRLETREQEWETRAERAAERVRLLTTGTHQL